jgi:hypothetical protein
MANPATPCVTATIRAGPGVPSAKAVTPLLTASTRSMNNARLVPRPALRNVRTPPSVAPQSPWASAGSTAEMTSAPLSRSE